uniref:G-protein coupled receptors family 1 profile domain-containing protein n=1 Tax=Parascaris univalens TaxID=6257 RepID=A0A914ZRS3_PARUN
MSTLMDTPNGFLERCDSLLNMSEEEMERLMDRLSSTIYSQYWISFGCMPIPLTCLTAACTIAYILTIYAAMKTRRVSRKCYMLLLNRAVGDLLCCVFFFCCSVYIFLVSADQFRTDILLIIATLCGSCYWTAMVSYVSLSVLKLFAVYEPLKYKKVFSTSHCLRLIILSWLIYALAVIVTLTAAAFVRVPSLRKWSGCKRETCMHALERARTIAISVIYVFTLVVYISTVITLKTTQRSSRSLRRKIEKNNSQRFTKKFPLWRLTLSVSTFAIFNFGYIIASIALIPRNRCHIFLNHSENANLIGAIWLSLLIRILIDAVLGLCTDSQLREVTMSLSHPKSSGKSIPNAKRKVADRCPTFPQADSVCCEARL